MKKYLVLYKSNTSVSEQMANATPEQAKAGMDGWMEWSKQAGDAIVDLGQPTDHAIKVTKDGAEKAESHVGGYSIIQAESEEQIKKMMGMHPHLMMEGNTIMVLEMLPMPGM